MKNKRKMVKSQGSVKKSSFWKVLGPGLLYAGAAVGVSHLVQSTRAGAMFNFDLLWVLIVANILKYPFFDYGARYANATGKNLISGYADIGKWAVILFALLSFVSMFIIQAAVTVVTVGLFAYIFNITISVVSLSLWIMGVSVLILLAGKYSLLDKLIKFIIVLLAVSTIVAVFSALGIDKQIDPDSLRNFTWTDKADILFLIAFVGWMPAPIDVSVWSSIWTVEKNKEIEEKVPLKDTLFEFRVGYIGTAILAMGFLSLGALVMYGTGEKLSASGTVFAGQLINMYATSIGKWSFWIISIAAFTTMFSTTITVLDAYSRVIPSVITNLMPKSKNSLPGNWLWLTIMLVGTLIIIIFFAKSMRVMVDIATTLSFVTAPILAYLNYKVVTSDKMPEYARPGKGLRILSWIGIIFFVVFTIIYLYWAV
jgi:Mn2+/Fe2+ NRAMP family transporter